MTRRRLLLAVPVLLLVLALAGGLGFWLTRSDDHGAESQGQSQQAAGVDAPPEPADHGPATNVLALPEPGLSLDYLESLRQSLYSELQRQLEEAAAASYAAARAEDEKVAAEAIRVWGRGQLLLSMPSINITASVEAIGFVPGTRNPSIPYTPWGVGWYDFTPFPGVGGNSVFSGHVDWYTGAPAVFGRLASVKEGDSIYLVLADGTPMAYEVTQRYYVTPYTADIGEIFGLTASEAITFVTCGGTWDPVAHDYSHRLIVRALRVR